MQVRVFCCHIMQALDLDVEDKNAIPDAAKAARLLTDNAAVSQEMDISGLTIVDAENEYLEIVSQKVNDWLTARQFTCKT